MTTSLASAPCRRRLGCPGSLVWPTGSGDQRRREANQGEQSVEPSKYRIRYRTSSRLYDYVRIASRILARPQSRRFARSSPVGPSVCSVVGLPGQRSVSEIARGACALVRRGESLPFSRYLRSEIGRTRREYRQLFRLSLRRWLLYHQSQVVYDRCSWMGLKAIKNPLDAWIYQEIIHEVRPDVVIEIGSAAGGGTLYLAHLLDIIGSGLVVSIDNDRSTFAAEHERIVTVTGHSSAPETLASVRTFCADKRVLVIHDADHHRDQVLEDLLSYSPLVSVGSYFIVEDGIVDLFRPHELLGVLYDGPLAATEEFLRRNPDFEVDRERERYLLTYNPRGFLRRVG